MRVPSETLRLPLSYGVLTSPQSSDVLSLAAQIELLKQTAEHHILLVQFSRGLYHQNGVVEPLLACQLRRVAKYRFKTAGTERESLSKREVGLLQHPFLFARRLGAVGTPGVNPADGRPEFGEQSLRLIVSDKARITSESTQVAVHLRFF